MADKITPRSALKTLRARARGGRVTHTIGDMTIFFETRYADYADNFKELVEIAGGVVYGHTNPKRRSGSVVSRWHRIEFTVSSVADQSHLR